MNQHLFLTVNALACHDARLDLLGIVLAEYTPYLFILAEVHLYFFGHRKVAAVSAFYAVIVGLGLNQIIGTIYHHHRPFVDHLGQALVAHAPDSSFPSNHTTFMAAIALRLLMHAQSRRWGGWLLGLTILGGVARVFVGVHYPFDIMGGIMTGALGALSVSVGKPYWAYLTDWVLKIDTRVLGTKG